MKGEEADQLCDGRGRRALKKSDGYISEKLKKKTRRWINSFTFVNSRR